MTASLPITRRYVRIATRQVHYRHAGHGPPVVLLHASPRGSQSLEPLMRAAPDGLSLFALDTPGYGHSDPLPVERRTLEDFVSALAATLDALGLGRVLLYGTHTGAAIAVAFAVAHPDRVARLVLDGISSFDATERADLLGAYLPSFAPSVDGTHMTWLWSRVRDQALFFPWHRRETATRLRRPIASPRSLHRIAVDLLTASDYRSAYAAAIAADGAAWVARLAVAATIGARSDDILAPHLDRLGDLPYSVETERFPSDADAAARRIWDRLLASADLAGAPSPIDRSLPADFVGDAVLGPWGERVHWRGRVTGTARPLVWLHESPGSAAALDRGLFTRAAEGPVMALDLPGHGESDAADRATQEAMLAAVRSALDRAGLVEADLAGRGIGVRLASALARSDPTRWQDVSEVAERGRRAPPPSVVARADGGHLFAAWQAARDDAILGHWWSRAADGRHDFGPSLDLDGIQRAAVAHLTENGAAAAWRRAVAG